MPTKVPTLQPTPEHSANPSQTPSQIPTEPYYYTVCGKINGGACNNPSVVIEPASGTAVPRCCINSSTQPDWIDGWYWFGTQSAWLECETDVWADSPQIGDDNCHGQVTWQEAVDLCAEVNANLCTLEQLENENCGQGTGCAYDNSHVWSSTMVGADA